MLLTAIYIPIAHAIEYWRWILLIVTLLLLTASVVRMIERQVAAPMNMPRNAGFGTLVA